MGLYYTPQPPHIGSAQPLEGKKLTPPAGPVPQNPPFDGGSRINPAILGCWAAVAVAAAVLPTLPRNLTPPSAPVSVRPVPNTALQNILAAWTPAPWTPVVAINLDPPIPGPGLSLVIFDAKSSSSYTGLGGSTFTDSTKLTVANNPNRALIVTVNLSGSPSAFSATWDGVAMTQIGFIAQSTFDTTTVMFGLRNPNPGTKTLTVSWSNTSDFVANAASFYNVDQTSDALAFANVATAQGTTSPASVTVTSVPGDMVLATHTLGAFVTQFTSISSGQHYNDKNNSMAGAASRAGATGSSMTMTAVESAAAPWTSIGVDIKPAQVPPAAWPQAATIAAWAPPYQPPIVGPKLPPQQAAAAAFPFRGSRVPTEVLAAWTPAPFFQIVQELLSPPIAGPVAQNPPFVGGAEIQQAILNAWIPPPPMPIVADNLVPPIAGPVASNPPFNGGAQVPQAVLNAWIPPPPAPIAAVNLDPPIAGPVASNPPFMGGSEVQQAILNAWIPPPWIPVVADNLTPPSAPVATFVPPARFPAEILNAWQVVVPAAIVAQNLTPPSGPVAAFTPPTRFQVEVFDAWVPLPFAAITARNLTPPSGPVTTFPPLGSFVPREVLICWLPLPPAPIVAVNMNPPISGPAADNPPFIGALVPVAMPEDWIPVVARNLTPSSAPTPYVPIGSRIPVEILNAWIPPAPMPMVAINLNPPISAPANLPVGGGARVPGEVLINWLPPAPMPVLARNLTPPSGPVASNPPFTGGASLKLEIQLCWQAAQPGYPPLKAINKTPPTGPGSVTTVIHAKPFFVSFGLRPL